MRDFLAIMLLFWPVKLVFSRTIELREAIETAFLFAAGVALITSPCSEFCCFHSWRDVVCSFTLYLCEPR